jgi:hypothetical protein
VAQWLQIPDTLDIVFVQGDEVNILLDFDQDLSGYAFETKIIRVIQVSGGNVTEFEDAMSFTQTPVNLATGHLNLSLQEPQTATLLLGGNYRWFMRWFSDSQVTRTVLSGTVTVRSP